ncbi:MAG: hypothetical protein K6T83_03165 [Alicyclobacillus sp.]|nr:hypothetical protein [Alicyclobacillus sp.]
MSTNPPGMRTYSSYQPAYRSDQQFVNGNPIPDLIPPELIIEKYLAGLPLQATAISEDLRDIVQQKIDAAVGEFETSIGSFLVPRVILSCVPGNEPQVITDLTTTKNPTGMVSGRPAVAGEDYDMLELPYPYTTRRFEKWSTVKLRHRPVLEVTSVIYALPPNFGILKVPQPWIVADPNGGILRIVPVEGAMAVMSPGAGMWLPFFTMGQMNHVPAFTQVCYTAGISPISTDMVDAVARLAAAYVLEVYDAAYYPGVQSFSHNVDGFNQQVQFRQGGPFAAQIKRFREHAEKYIAKWRQAHNGIRMAQLGR